MPQVACKMRLPIRILHRVRPPSSWTPFLSISSRYLTTTTATTTDAPAADSAQNTSVESGPSSPHTISSDEPVQNTTEEARSHFVSVSPPAYPYGPARWHKRTDRGLYGGVAPRSGNSVSHKTKTKTRRRWLPNVRTQRIYSIALGKQVLLRVTQRALRSIDKCGGLDEYLLGEKPARLKELGMLGWKLRWAVMQTPTYRERFRRECEALGLTEGEGAEEIRALIAEQESGGREVEVRQRRVPAGSKGFRTLYRKHQSVEVRDEDKPSGPRVPGFRDFPPPAEAPEVVARAEQIRRDWLDKMRRFRAQDEDDAPSADEDEARALRDEHAALAAPEQQQQQLFMAEQPLPTPSSTTGILVETPAAPTDTDTAASPLSSSPSDDDLLASLDDPIAVAHLDAHVARQLAAERDRAEAERLRPYQRWQRRAVAEGAPVPEARVGKRERVRAKAEEVAWERSRILGELRRLEAGVGA